jgi:cysteine-rich repeat protein
VTARAARRWAADPSGLPAGLGFVVGLAVGGCSVIVDGNLDGKPSGAADLGPPPDVPSNPCLGAAPGTTCEDPSGGAFVCRSGLCVPSVCGDGVPDARTEECDDGNANAGDGCDPDCTFSCSDDSGCADGNDCTENTCDTAAHRCELRLAADGKNCTLAEGGEGMCRMGECRAAGCGNGVVAAPEQCDDGNMDDDDGCRSDCRFTCSTNLDCDDGNVCNGVEACMNGGSVASRCAPGTTLTCDDRSPCTADSCDPARGCAFTLIDMDGDGQAPASLGTCGRDCNDMRADVYRGASELCDGVDNDCDGMIDEEAPTWYVDCDGDGFAANETGARTACERPSVALTGCTGAAAGWTTRRPADAATTDCFDGNALVRPNQTAFQTTAAAGRPASVDFDYDCNGTEERQYTALEASSTRTCRSVTGGVAFGCVGTTYWRSTSAPACGASGTLSYCAFVGSTGGLLICQRTEGTRTQGCR